MSFNNLSVSWWSLEIDFLTQFTENFVCIKFYLEKVKLDILYYLNRPSITDKTAAASVYQHFWFVLCNIHNNLQIIQYSK